MWPHPCPALLETHTSQTNSALRPIYTSASKRRLRWEPYPVGYGAAWCAPLSKCNCESCQKKCSWSICHWLMLSSFWASKSLLYVWLLGCLGSGVEGEDSVKSQLASWVVTLATGPDFSSESYLGRIWYPKITNKKSGLPECYETGVCLKMHEIKLAHLY